MRKTICCYYWQWLELIVLVESSCYVFYEWFVLAWKLLLGILFLASLFIFSDMFSSFFMIIIDALNAGYAAMGSIDKDLYSC